MTRYAQLSGPDSNGVRTVSHNVVESETDPDGILGEWVACGNAGPGSTTTDGGLTFTAPTAPADPCANLIDLGPFYDRAGVAKMPILTSTDATVKAIIGDLNIRKWVDLTRADVASALGYIGSVVPALTPAIQAAMLATPVAAVENLALRKLYF